VAIRATPTPHTSKAIGLFEEPEAKLSNRHGKIEIKW